jgi:uncharacterized repeat protein (TIGR01451 family)
MKKIIIASAVLFLVVAIAGLWYWQKNSYSKDALKLEILAPSEATIAQEIEYIVKYKNNGDSQLEDPKLIFEFPSNSQTQEGGLIKEVGASEIGAIYPGQEQTIKFKCRLFGKEDEIKTANVRLSYSPKGLKARYESSTTANVKIKPIPITFDIELPSKEEAGRDLGFSLNYFSSLDYPLTNMRIKIDYPDGFEFLESTPKALDKNEWEVPLLNKSQGGRIDIKGRISGQEKDQKIFSATLGLWLGDNFISLKEINAGTEIIKPSLSVFQRINNSDNYIPQPGESLHYEIFFRNIGEAPFNNLFLTANLDGAFFDFDSIKTTSGKINKGDGSIIWDWRAVSELAYLDQGEEGKVEFWINLKDDISSSNNLSRNAILKNKVLISQIAEEFANKVGTKLFLAQKVFYSDEIFGNSGQFPPKAGESTTFTIVWQAKNYYNDLKNARVKAVLPKNVFLTGKIFPEDQVQKFSFDSASREIIWRIGDDGSMPAGTGVSTPAPNIAFQVSLVPDYTQAGRTAPIIGEAKISGEDLWTGSYVEESSSAVNTTLPDDKEVADHSGIIK